MKRFVEGEDRRQATLLPECQDDYVAPDNPVRIIEALVDELNLKALGFAGVVPEVTGRPSYHHATLLKIYIYGYLNRVPSSRRLERETQRNLELIWLTGRLMPDFKTIADFRRDNGPAIRAACAQFIELCRKLNLFTWAVVAIDGSKLGGGRSRPADLTDRSGCTLHGHQRQGHRHCRLQRADGGGGRAPPHRGARGDQRRQRPHPTARYGTASPRRDGV
jgi:transposase